MTLIRSSSSSLTNTRWRTSFRMKTDSIYMKIKMITIIRNMPSIKPPKKKITQQRMWNFFFWWIQHTNDNDKLQITHHYYCCCYIRLFTITIHTDTVPSLGDHDLFVLVVLVVATDHHMNRHIKSWVFFHYKDSCIMVVNNNNNIIMMFIITRIWAVGIGDSRRCGNVEPKQKKILWIK